MRHPKTLRPHHKEEGFTIVELMVTVTIMAILGVIAFNIYSRQKMQAYSTAVKTDVMNASIYIASNPELKEYSGNTIPGLQTSKGVTITAFSKFTDGYTCIQGEHEKDKTLNKAESTWHVLLRDKKLKKGGCTA